MNIFSEEFWNSQTNLKSKVYLYRMSRKGSSIKCKLLETDGSRPIGEVKRLLGGLPHGAVPCDEGKLRARELAFDDFISQMISEVKDGKNN